MPRGTDGSPIDTGGGAVRAEDDAPVVIGVDDIDLMDTVPVGPVDAPLGGVGPDGGGPLASVPPDDVGSLVPGSAGAANTSGARTSSRSADVTGIERVIGAPTTTEGSAAPTVGATVLLTIALTPAAASLITVVAVLPTVEVTLVVASDATRDAEPSVVLTAAVTGVVGTGDAAGSDLVTVVGAIGAGAGGADVTGAVTVLVR
jgi:hypothetical protein